MNKKERSNLFSDLLSLLSEYYSNLGFDLNGEVALFTKGQNQVFWGSKSIFDSFVTFRPQIRIDNQQIKKLSKKIFPNKLNHLTYGCSQSLKLAYDLGIDNFNSKYIKRYNKGLSDYHYRVSELSELSDIVNDHIHFMNVVGFKFFEELGSVESISLFLNDRIDMYTVDEILNDEVKRQLQTFYSEKAVTSGLLANLILESDNFITIANKYRTLFDDNNYMLKLIQPIIEYWKQKESL